MHFVIYFNVTCFDEQLASSSSSGVLYKTLKIKVKYACKQTDKQTNKLSKHRKYLFTITKYIVFNDLFGAHMWVHMYACMCACMRTCVCMDVSMDVCMHIRLHVYDISVTF